MQYSMEFKSVQGQGKSGIPSDSLTVSRSRFPIEEFTSTEIELHRTGTEFHRVEIGFHPMEINFHPLEIHVHSMETDYFPH